MPKLKVLDLFSGIGGFSIGLERTGGFETVAFCEIEKFPQKVLAKHWPGVPIYEDVRELTAERLRADGIVPDIITGGFPCQDISVAGKQEGIDGARSGLWSECARLLGEVRPQYAIFENVTALLSGYSGKWFQRVLLDISAVGYDAEWHCISASELGANHHRDRVWIIAYPSKLQCNECDPDNEYCQCYFSEFRDYYSKKPVTNANSQRLQGSAKPRVFKQGRQGMYELTPRLLCNFKDISKIEPTICRGDDGVFNHAHRLKGLGNAVVPQIPELIGRAILEVENV
jgi:DNA (cytosine-5)-methyltransferase 1